MPEGFAPASTALVDSPPPRYSEDISKVNSASAGEAEHGSSWISAVHAVSISTSIAPASYKSRSSSNADTDSLRSKLEPGISRTKAHQHMRGLEQAASVFRWNGEGKVPQAWGKLRKDSELWDNQGDTCVFFGKQRPEASFRVQSALIEATRSPYLTAMLREGFKNKNGYSYTIMGSSAGAASSSSSTRSSIGLRKAFRGLKKKGSQAKISIPEGGLAEREGPVLYDLFFPAPDGVSRLDVLRYHITTRNLFAFLENKPLVGLTFYQALVDLHERLDMYLPEDTDVASSVIKYLVSNRFDDVRNVPAAAAGLLAWSEEPNVRWNEGWREAFVHCVGMFDQLSVLPEFNDISPISKKLLEKCRLEQEARAFDVEKRLSSFNFVDIWPTQSAWPPPARVAFDRFSRFLKQVYTNNHKTWPPRGDRDDGSGWLTRDVALNLQKDFGSLYDYLVDRDITWSESGPKKQRRIISRSGREDFVPDSENLPVTDLLVYFDKKHSFPGIPLPYPMVPTSIPVQYGVKPSSLGYNKRKEMEKRHQGAYSQANNSFPLGQEQVSNELVKAFIRYEKADQVGEIDPHDARLGRWLLLYGVLQVLATVSVDTPELRFTKDVHYFLNPRLKGTPPWKGTDATYKEATSQGSHCWSAARSWARHDGSGASKATLATRPKASGDFGPVDEKKESMKLRMDEGLSLRAKEVGKSSFVPPEGW